jgi:hypothetical protein
VEYTASQAIFAATSADDMASYYLLEEALGGSPEIVVFNVLAMNLTGGKRGYNRLTLDGMRLSPLKIRR